MPGKEVIDGQRCTQTTPGEKREGVMRDAWTNGELHNELKHDHPRLFAKTNIIMCWPQIPLQTQSDLMIAWLQAVAEAPEWFVEQDRKLLMDDGFVQGACLGPRLRDVD